MNQEFIIGNLKLVQDEDGYGVCRQIEEGMWQPIATFMYPEDAIGYFSGIIMNAVAVQQANQQDIQITNLAKEKDED